MHGSWKKKGSGAATASSAQGFRTVAARATRSRFVKHLVNHPAAPGMCFVVGAVSQDLRIVATCLRQKCGQHRQTEEGSVVIDVLGDRRRKAGSPRRAHRPAAEGIADDVPQQLRLEVTFLGPGGIQDLPNAGAGTKLACEQGDLRGLIHTWIVANGQVGLVPQVTPPTIPKNPSSAISYGWAVVF